MPKGPLHWLEIISTGAVAHVCRISNEVMAFPDEAESRQDYRLRIQPDLLSWIDDGEQETLGKLIRVIPRLYAWLMFHAGGDGEVKRFCVGSPAADANEWIAYIDIVAEIAKSGIDLPKVDSIPTAKDKLRFRDHIVEQLEKDKKKSDEDKGK
jgi:hypothetical protein